MGVPAGQAVTVSAPQPSATTYDSRLPFDVMMTFAYRLGICSNHGVRHQNVAATTYLSVLPRIEIAAFHGAVINDWAEAEIFSPIFPK